MIRLALTPEPTQPEDFTADLQLTGHTTPSWGAEYGGYLAGDVVTIGEQTTLPPGCTNTPSGDLGARTLVAGLNRYTVTNTVTCRTQLTLLKSVVNPDGPPEPADSWTLSVEVRSPVHW